MGETGRVYQVLATDDIGVTNWPSIGLMEHTNEMWRFLDSGATNHAWRSYRAVQVP